MSKTTAPAGLHLSEDMSPEQIQFLLEGLERLPMEEKLALLDELDALEERQLLRSCRDDFLTFCHTVYDSFKEGPHHRHMKPLLHEVKDGTLLRVTVSMAPRFGKSITISLLFVAWYLGHNPKHHIMMVTHTASLSATFGRDVRNLISTPMYQKIFPDTIVSMDKSAADNWTTTAGGKYLAIGIGANVAGHGAHLLVADDLCIEENTIVYTAVGPRRAADVAVGDSILGEAGYQRVLRKTNSKHATAVVVQGETLSLEHPVWTFNRGWVRGGELRVEDLLRTTNVCAKIEASLRSFYAQRLGKTVTQTVPPRVQHLVHDEAAVPQPEGGKLRQLRRLWSDSVTRVRSLRGFFAYRGPGAHDQAHLGPHRQQHGVFARELPVGGRGDAAEQSHQWRPLRVPGADAVGATTGAHRRHSGSADGAPSQGDGADSVRSVGFTQAELGAAPRDTADFGWGVRAAVRLFGCSSRLRICAKVAAHEPTQGRSDSPWRAVLGQLQEKFVQCHESFSACVGLLVGVRRAGDVEHVNATGLKFVNFEVQGDNTFFAGNVLTHNCSEQSVLSGNPDTAFQTAFEYLMVGPLQRLMPGGRIVMIATRWGKRDPIGRSLTWAQENPGSIPWHEVRFPAILPSGKSLWPEQWPVEQLLAKKASMNPQFWAAQFMQEPTSEEGALLKREWWKVWPGENPPQCNFIIQSWDTAHETKNSHDYSACTTWGVWFDESDGRNKLILLNAFKARMEFPQLKRRVLAEYREWKPDCLLIEKKAAGAPLIQELRQMDIVVQEYSPSRGSALVSNDKRARVNAVSAILSSGLVYHPDLRWAHEVIQECAEFPNSEHDDFCDTAVQAWSRFRQGGFLRLDDDAPEEEQTFRSRRGGGYY